MKPEIKQKWVELLRSGKYIQATDRLKTGNAYCCLGVLCDLYIKETGKGHWEVGDHPSFILEEDELTIGLNGKLLKWVGMTNMEHNDCIKYNDTENLNFSQIADKIEEMQ